MIPYDLKCEYETRPLGLSEGQPRFSWKLTLPQDRAGSAGEPNDKGVASQAAYEIVVATAEAGLRRDSGVTPLWSTGRVESSASLHISYDGPPLEPFTRYYWTVRVWTDETTSYEAATPAQVWTGALSEKDWTAAWLTSSDPTTYISSASPFVEPITEYNAMYFYRGFEVPEGRVPVRAQLCIAARGVAETYVNGEKVGDHVIDPATTNYEHRTLYSAYDVTDLLSQRNAIGVVLGNGRHLAAYGYSIPSFSACLILELDDGSRSTVLTGQTWLSGTGPIRENGIYFGERYDSRREIPGWATPAQSTLDWASAAVMDPESGYTLTIKRAVESSGRSPAYQTIDPIRVTRTLDPVRMWSPQPGRYVFDFGQNLTGVTELTVSGPRGTTVSVRHSELVDDSGRLNTLPNRNARATNDYTLRGGTVERYRPTLTQHGFRYAEVSAYPGVPTLDSLRAICFHTAAEEIGEFAASRPLLNDVHRITRWSQRGNMMGILTDCPQRDERMGWLGDAQLASEEALYNFDMSRVYTKYLDDIRLSQREDGALSNVVPDFWKLYPADPAWGSAYATIAWNMYWHYGDQRILERHYDGISRYVGYLDSVARDGIIDSIVMIGDWCPPGSITPKRTPAELTSTWYYYHDTLLLAKMARVLRRDADATRLNESADRIREAFNARFLKDYGYAANQMTPSDVMPSQTSNVLPLYLEMVPADSCDLVIGRLLESVVKHHDYHLDTGIVGTRYLFDVLTRLGFDEAAYRIATQTSYPGWGYMLREGATTLWEHWEKIEGEGMNSNNHIMLGSVDAWYYSTIAGLRPAAAGWSQIEFRPHPVGDLRYASASLQTVRGRASISWEFEPSAAGGRFSLDLRVPPASIARLLLPPGRTATEITVNDGPVRVMPETLGSGHWSVAMSLSERTPPTEPDWRGFNALRRSISPGSIHRH